MTKLSSTYGYSLFELIVVIIIIGVIASVAMKSLSTGTDIARTEETIAEMDELAYAIAGNPALRSGGQRTDFGYVGDVGGLPSALSDLVTNPGLATWDGPYIRDDFYASVGGGAGEYAIDGWGAGYTLNPTSVVSTGSGETLTRSFAASADDLLNNRVTVVVLDLDETPPGITYRDSVEVSLRYPNGAGSFTTNTQTTASDGFVAWTGVPIGQQQIVVEFLQNGDSLSRRVAVEPGSDNHFVLRHYDNLWYDSSAAGGYGDTLLVATFDSDEDGFSYTDDAFLGTSQPDYADGSYGPSDGYSGGGVVAEVAGQDNAFIEDMSAGWEATFTLPVDSTVTIFFRYKLDQTSEYEGDEYTRAFMTVDGTQHGNPPYDYIDEIVGNGPGGSALTTGWQTFTVDVALNAGAHTIVIGLYNNQKTTINETSWIYIDDVIITFSGA